MATKHLTHCQRVNNSLMYSTIFIFNGGACAMSLFGALAHS